MKRVNWDAKTGDVIAIEMGGKWVNIKVVDSYLMGITYMSEQGETFLSYEKLAEIGAYFQEK